MGGDFFHFLVSFILSCFNPRPRMGGDACIRFVVRS